MVTILAINPGATSTKFAIYQNEQVLFSDLVDHPLTIHDQASIQEHMAGRLAVVDSRLQTWGITHLDVVIGRGGMLRPMEAGVYAVDERMVQDLSAVSAGYHASNLGGLMALEIASHHPNCLALIADPVVVDELQDLARLSGIPEMPRKSQFHALNQKAIARRYALSLGRAYESLKLVVAHLGGGVSVAAHRGGRVVDVNQALDGYGAFSPERAGTVDAGQLLALAFSGKYSQEKLWKLLVGGGGLVAHLGTNDVREVEVRIQQGDVHAAQVLDAMCYTIGKEIGAMVAVLHGDVDALLITGGIANSDYVIGRVCEMVGSMVRNVQVYPGENELEALALAALRVMRGEPMKKYAAD